MILYFNFQNVKRLNIQKKLLRHYIIYIYSYTNHLFFFSLIFKKKVLYILNLIAFLLFLTKKKENKK